MASLIIIIFIIGYIAIATENLIHINKAASALVAGVLCWTVYIIFTDSNIVLIQLNEQLIQISKILFFLIGAMTVVQLIDAHDGFSIVYKQIKSTQYGQLLWIICILTYFLSAVLDNLTTAIVMVTITNKLVKDDTRRLYFIGMIVLAANAGGVWSPIGDVTTTMLWSGDRITTENIIIKMFLPSLVCLLIPLIIAAKKVKGVIENFELDESEMISNHQEKNFIFFTGLAILIMVPFFKTITKLPPYMAMILGMGILWIITGLLHKNKSKREKYSLSVAHALENIDMPSVLFFFGILLAVGVLEASGQLQLLASKSNTLIHSEKIMVILIGLLSSIVDNVPLVAATMGMYPVSIYPIDHTFWLFLSYCAGTGGSLLIVGSAAGIAAMGIGKVSFGWYLKNMTLLSLIGFSAGIILFLFEEFLFKFLS
jgi:Na+/H+ antiporter NhaD/arsenite permease-like protein